MSDSNTLDLTDDELNASIVACRGMLEGMALEGSPRPLFLISAYNKFVATRNLKLDLDEL